MATRRRKVQVSIPMEEYDAIEKRWKSTGFSSVAEAARVMLMGDLNELVKEMRRQISALEKMEELQAKRKMSKQHVELRRQSPKLKRIRARTMEQVENILKRWLRGHIDEDKYKNAKGIRQWRDENGKTRQRLWNGG
jgi:signal recognition particle GTPase